MRVELACFACVTWSLPTIPRHTGRLIAVLKLPIVCLHLFMTIMPISFIEDTEVKSPQYFSATLLTMIHYRAHLGWVNIFNLGTLKILATALTTMGWYLSLMHYAVKG